MSYLGVSSTIEHDYAEKLKTFLATRAIVEHDSSQNTITISSNPYNFTDGSDQDPDWKHLHYIKDPAWNNITIPRSITIILKYWTITESGDKWALGWMKDRYTVVMENC